jgi:transcriptional regulator with XRE-family HTH domain
MTSADTPAVARRRVRLALRGAREGRGLTQSEVAEAMEWSLSKLMRIEKGQVNISRTDLRVLLAHLGVTDPATVKQLEADARVARNERSAIDPLEREHLTPALLQLMQFEQEATVIRHYGSMVVPGLVQTADYAQAVLEMLGESPAVVELKRDGRQRRRQRVLYRPNPPEYRMVLDEAVLWRQVGGRVVMAAQLRTLLTIMAEAPLVIRVLPFAAPGAIATLGPFILLDLGDDEYPVLYRDGVAQDEIVRAPTDVQRHQTAFESLWDACLDPAASTKLITERSAVMAAGEGSG